MVSRHTDLAVCIQLLRLHVEASQPAEFGGWQFVVDSWGRLQVRDERCGKLSGV